MSHERESPPAAEQADQGALISETNPAPVSQPKAPPAWIAVCPVCQVGRVGRFLRVGRWALNHMDHTGHAVRMVPDFSALCSTCQGLAEVGR